MHTDIPQFPEPGRAARQLHDLTVMGTLQLLAAVGDLPTLRTVVVRGSASIYGSAPTVTVMLEGDAASATGAGITLEPAGGSPEPTSTPLALFSFS